MPLARTWFQLSVWPLKEGKGVDDYLALKAGADPAKQRKEFASLLERAVPFLDTLDEHDIPAVKKELHRVEMDPAQFAALAKALARKLGTTKKALGAYEYDEEASEESKAINIPPTAAPWDGEVKAAEVLDGICATLARFVWMKPSYYRAVALWIVLSYLHDAVDILPILTITSPDQECGKTTLLKMVFNLCNRPVSASNISAAAIYRIIGEDCPCLTLDEADSYMQEDEAMRGIINSGHERQMAFVIRVINDKGNVGRFPTWCPKAIAMIGLPRRTILSRSIHIRIERKDKGTKLEKLRRKHYAQFEDLRRKIAKLANDIRERVKGFETDDQLGNRTGDNWDPLLAIASAAGEDWLAEAVTAAERISGKDAHDAKSFNKYLLESLGRIIAARREAELIEPETRFFLRTQDLLTELNQDDEAPLKERAKDELSANKLRNVLVSYGVKPIQVRTGQESKPVRGYWSDDLERIIKHYE